MTTPNWPATLPQAPLRQGYSREAGDGILRTQMEAGAPKSRPRYTSAPGSMACSFLMTQAQLESFKAWWKTSIARGALSFLLPDPENPGQTVEVRPTGPYKTGERGPGRWAVALELMVFE